MIKKLKPKSEFSRNVLTLMTGTTIAQAIPVAISPILTRIYSPDEFGLFAIYMAIAIIFSVIATGRYELAIMLPENEKYAQHLVILSILVALLISLILLMVVFFFNNQITALLKKPEISSWLYLIPVSVFFTGLYQSFNYWNNRKKQYLILSKSRVVQSGSMAGGQVGFGLLGSGVGGLITGHIIGRFFGSLFLGKLFFQYHNSTPAKNRKLKILALAKRYKKFPMINMWAALLNTSAFHVPVILLSILFNSTITGFFSLALRILMMPMTLIGMSIGQVYFQQISIIKNDANAVKIQTINLYKKLLLMAIVPIVISMLFGDVIFAFVFGEAWREAGVYVQYLSVWIFFVFVGSPLSHLYTVYEKHKQFVIYNLLLFISRVSVLFIGSYLYDDVLSTIILYGVIGAIFSLGFAFYLMRLAGVTYIETFKYTSPYFIVCIASIFVSKFYIN